MKQGNLFKVCFNSVETRKCSLQTLLSKLVILIVGLGVNTKFITTNGNTLIKLQFRAG